MYFLRSGLDETVNNSCNKHDDNNDTFARDEVQGPEAPKLDIGALDAVMGGIYTNIMTRSPEK